MYEAQRLESASSLIEAVDPYIQEKVAKQLIAYQSKANDERQRYCIQHLLTRITLLTQERSKNKELTITPLAGLYTVEKIIDGDTLHVHNGTQTFVVRLLGIDTPEKNEQGYSEATTQLTTLLLGKEVSLIQDNNNPTQDKYGRTLAYVYLGDKLVNLDLIEDGYARVFTVEKHLFTALFTSAERKRKKQNPIRRRYCSEFTSCDDAKHALSDGASYLDGDNDQLPCETGVCKI